MNDNEKRVTCPQCQGTCEQHFEEDNRPVVDVCYACEDGTIPWSSYQKYRQHCAAVVIAERMLILEKQDINSDPDGEGWAFGAAENGMSVYDYGTVRHMSLTDQVMNYFANIDGRLVRVLTDQFCPQEAPDGIESR